MHALIVLMQLKRTISCSAIQTRIFWTYSKVLPSMPPVRKCCKTHCINSIPKHKP